LTTAAPTPFEALIARLAAEPDLGLLARDGAGVLVWDGAGERLLWTSPAARELGAALTDGSGRLAAGARIRDRLKALAEGLAPREGARMERLRLDPSKPWLPIPCACRLASLNDGTPVLVTSLIGRAVPKIATRARPLQGAPFLSEEEPAFAPAAESAAPREHALGPIRFVWHADAETRFTDVSSGLAEAVGPSAGNIVGKTWDELSRTVVDDPDGAVAALFARRQTWSGQTVFWSMDKAPSQVPVDWAGMPVFGANRELVGFRGFGLLRMDELRDREVEAEPSTDLVTQSLVTDETLPFSPPEERGGEEPAAGNAPAEDDNWFANLRNQVAEALSGPTPPEPEPQSPRKQPPASTLSNAERNAFREIARALGARLEGDAPPEPEKPAPENIPREAKPVAEDDEPLPPTTAAPAHGDRVLDRLPIGILVHRGEDILFANRFLLDLTGYDDVGQIQAEGGLVHLFRGSPALGGSDNEDSALALTNRRSETIAVTVRSSSAEWGGEDADLLVIGKVSLADAVQTRHRGREQELEAILDTATDGVIVLDETGRILSLNRSAEALFGYDEREVAGDAITVLLAPESHIVALDYLESLRSPGVRSLLNDGREVLGRERQGGGIPLFMTMGRLGDGPNRRFCAVLRDITVFKKAEGELIGAKHAAEEASAQKSDLLAKISHEIRTPLNAILGFAEVMLEERFGPIGNERYKEYLKDVHASGSHVISLVNDLLDLAKIEAGRLELSFTGVSLNELVSSCVTLLQPQAARDRIVMRMSFASKLPPVVADERSIRQIVLNLVSNAIKFTDAGGQVIVSTALTDRGEVAFRVRDTGIGMTSEEVEAALEPFRQLATSRKRGGTGLGLPLTKALVEANQGALQISSQPSEGTLVEVIFPPTRVWAEQ
jgi:PAS domain S-box-containing protein